MSITQFAAPAAALQQNKGFFAASKKVSVDVGGNGDCGFRAVAACLIELFEHNNYAITTNKELIAKLYSKHIKYFPSHKVDLKASTAAERFVKLIKGKDKMTMIVALAYTLRQLAVDEMVQNPASYRGAFVEENENTSPSLMRQGTTEIDESAIAALAKVLGMPISVQVAEPGKFPFLNFEYNVAQKKGAFNPGLTIRLEKSHYKPMLSNSKALQAPSVVSIDNLLEKDTASHDDPDMESIMEQIKQADELMIECYEQSVADLNRKVAQGKLSKESLLTIYIESMNHSDYLQGRVKQVGLEHGSATFFSDLLNAHGKANPFAQIDDGLHSTVQQELVHAIARAISIGHIDAANIANYEEHEELMSVATQ